MRFPIRYFFINFANLVRWDSYYLNRYHRNSFNLIHMKRNIRDLIRNNESISIFDYLLADVLLNDCQDLMYRFLFKTNSNT